jgi:hypothetical protein
VGFGLGRFDLLIANIMSVSRTRAYGAYRTPDYSPVQPYHRSAKGVRLVNRALGPESSDPCLPLAVFRSLPHFEPVFFWRELVDFKAVARQWPDPDDQDPCGNEMNDWRISGRDIVQAFGDAFPSFGALYTPEYTTVRKLAAAASSPDQGFVWELRRTDHTVYALLSEDTEEAFTILLDKAHTAILRHFESDVFIPLAQVQPLVQKLLETMAIPKVTFERHVAYYNASPLALRSLWMLDPPKTWFQEADDREARIHRYFDVFARSKALEGDDMLWSAAFKQTFGNAL